MNTDGLDSPKSITTQVSIGAQFSVTLELDLKVQISTTFHRPGMKPIALYIKGQGSHLHEIGCGRQNLIGPFGLLKCLKVKA